MRGKTVTFTGCVVAALVAAAFLAVVPTVEGAAYQATVGDIKVKYTKGGCLAYYDYFDDTLTIQVWEDGGILTVTAGRNAPAYWGWYCDIFIWADLARIKKMNFKGRRDFSLYICGVVEYALMFNAKYCIVGNTDFYGMDAGLCSWDNPPKKISFTAGYSTAEVFGWCGVTAAGSGSKDAFDPEVSPEEKEALRQSLPWSEKRPLGSEE